MQRDLKRIRDSMDKLLRRLDQRVATSVDQADPHARMQRAVVGQARQHAAMFERAMTLSLERLSSAGTHAEPMPAPQPSSGLAERHAGVYPALCPSDHPLAS